jgi:RNA polymerase sigma-70 factor (ECF subfamily)
VDPATDSPPGLPKGPLTEVLDACRRGAPGAADALYRGAYEELRRLAVACLRRERPGHTLQPTALVHEAYLRLVGTQAWQDRGHFFAAAARAMREILVDHARARRALKRGGGRTRLPLGDAPAPEREPWEEVLAVHEVLPRLEALDPLKARVVELRFFGGLDVEQTSHVLGVSERTVHRAWEHARAWLFRELSA